MNSKSKHKTRLFSLETEGRNTSPATSEARYHQLFEDCPVGILEEDYSAIKEFFDSSDFNSGDEVRKFFLGNPEVLKALIGSVSVNDVNEATLKAYKCTSKEEFVEDHRDFDDWYDSNWGEFYIDELVALFVGNLPFQREYTDIAMDWSKVRIRNVTRFVRGYEDSWSRVVSIVEDITDRREIEARLHQAQKMEAIGQLTGGLAHDVNNILAIISGNAELLEEQIKGKNTQVQEIFHAIKTGSSLVQQLLSFSRKQPLEPRPVQVNDLVTAFSHLLGRTLGESIDISLKTADGLWMTETDPSQFENALLNIVLNSRDAMPEGGRLKIETTNETIDHPLLHNDHVIPAGQYVVISVIDNGSGMSSKQQSRVFEPFYTTKDIGSGSGLGLSSVYGFIKQSGGHINLFSTQGMGTEVRLYLPRTSANEGILFQMPEEESIPGDGETVLVLEDEKILSALVSKMLTDLGYRVLVAKNGLEALNILEKSGKVDLLLSDIGLPGGMNGVVVAEKAKDIQPDLKFQFMSGYIENTESSFPEMKKYGDVLDKPFRKSTLAKRLRRVLDSE